MSDGNRLLSDVSSPYGAPMGRRNYRDGAAGKVRLFRVRINSGGYDTGGAYWGIGQPLYCADGENFQVFIRADDREHAKAKLLRDYPQLTFYR